LIHWPFAWEFCGSPLNENTWKGVDGAGNIRFDHGVTLQQTWFKPYLETKRKRIQQP